MLNIGLSEYKCIIEQKGFTWVALPREGVVPFVLLEKVPSPNSLVFCSYLRSVQTYVQIEGKYYP